MYCVQCTSTYTHMHIHTLSNDLTSLTIPHTHDIVSLSNNIGADGAKCLADGLQHCPNLQTLK